MKYPYTTLLKDMPLGLPFRYHPDVGGVSTVINFRVAVPNTPKGDIPCACMDQDEMLYFSLGCPDDKVVALDPATLPVLDEFKDA